MENFKKWEQQLKDLETQNFSQDQALPKDRTPIHFPEFLTDQDNEVHIVLQKVISDRSKSIPKVDRNKGYIR